MTTNLITPYPLPPPSFSLKSKTLPLGKVWRCDSPEDDIFNKIYSNFKAKMLPPSLNSKNRLFIERDSKHRRITANIGTTFRNSKWRNYTLKNTSTLDRSNYLRSLLSFFKVVLSLYIIYVFILCFSALGLDTFIVDRISDHLECEREIIQHWRDFLPVLLHFMWRIVYEEITNYLLGSHSHSFSTVVGRIRRTIYSVVTQDPYKAIIAQGEMDKESSRELDSIVPATHLTRHYADLLTATLVDIDANSRRRIDFNHFPVKQLFDVVYLLPQYDRPVIRLAGRDADCGYPGVVPMYMPAFRPKKLPTEPRYRTKEIDRWLPSYGRHARLKNKVSYEIFNCGDLDYQLVAEYALHNELYLIAESMVYRTDAAKIMRWSYRYNLLHRKSMINSHKLTSAKKLLGPGFFDSTSSQNNVWFSTNFSRQNLFDSSSTLKQLNAHWHLMYRSSLGSSPITHIGSQNFKDIQKSFNFLCYYESSFHFLLKRVSTFLTLGSNVFTSTPSLNTSSNNSVDRTDRISNNAWRMLVTNLGRSITLTGGVINPWHSRISLINTSAESNSLNLTKDVVLPTWEYDFLTDDQLDMLINITASLSSDSRSISFFSVDFTSQIDYTADLHFVTSESITSNLFSPFFVLLRNEQYFVKDLYLLSALYSGKLS